VHITKHNSKLEIGDWALVKLCSEQPKSIKLLLISRHLSVSSLQ
jgi:hypothetical protein